MPTNRMRTPRGGDRRVPITEAALKAFSTMLRLERKCTCPPYKYGQHNPQCRACERWWDAHQILFTELQCKPWEWPCIEAPVGDEPASSWKRLARHRYRVLAAALRARRQARHAARRPVQPEPAREPEPMM
jgi:hypothetical protein